MERLGAISGNFGLKRSESGSLVPAGPTLPFERTDTAFFLSRAGDKPYALVGSPPMDDLARYRATYVGQVPFGAPEALATPVLRPLSDAGLDLIALQGITAKFRATIT